MLASSSGFKKPHSILDNLKLTESNTDNMTLSRA